MKLFRVGNSAENTDSETEKTLTIPCQHKLRNNTISVSGLAGVFFNDCGWWVGTFGL